MEYVWISAIMQEGYSVALLVPIVWGVSSVQIFSLSFSLYYKTLNIYLCCPVYLLVV
jgi:hypothetical protein